MKFFEWSSAESSAGYLGKTKADQQKMCWSDPIMGVPLVKLSDWEPPLLNQYLGDKPDSKNMKFVGDAPRSGYVNLISRCAADALKDIWNRHTQLYPVVLEDQPEEYFYMVVVKTELDCLDREKSTGPLQKYGPTPELFASVETWVFDDECIGDNDLFVLPDSSTTIFVSEYFKQRVADAGLKGFCLKTEFWEADPWISQ